MTRNKKSTQRTNQAQNNTARLYSLVLTEQNEKDYNTLCVLTSDEYSQIEEELYAAGDEDGNLKSFSFEVVPNFTELRHWLAYGQLPHVPDPKVIEQHWVVWEVDEGEGWPFEFPTSEAAVLDSRAEFRANAMDITDRVTKQ